MREVAGKTAALAWNTLNVERCIVTFEYVLDDGQSQAYASFLTASTGIHPEKPFRKPGNMLRFDSGSRVRYRQAPTMIVGRP